VLEKVAPKAPEFVVKLHDKSVRPTERVTFECKVEAEPDAKITWFKGEEKLAEEPGKLHVESEPDGTQRLILESAEPSQEGDYSCVAENPLGQAKTEAKLTVECIHFNFYKLNFITAFTSFPKISTDWAR